MRYSTISKIGAFTALSSATPDYLSLVPGSCSGGDDPPLRTTIEPAAGIDGAFVFPPLDDAWIITLAGDFVITSAGDEAGYLAAQDTLFSSLQTALDALKTAPDDLTHSGGTLQVWKYAPISGSWSGIVKSVTFGLVVDVFA